MPLHTVYSVPILGGAPGSRTKIGSASNILVRGKSGSTPPIIYAHGGVAFNTMNCDITLQDWDDINTPASPEQAKAMSENAPSIIAALVHMLGGAVTIQPHELNAPPRVVVSFYNDPWYMQIKQEGL